MFFNYMSPDPLLSQIYFGWIIFGKVCPSVIKICHFLKSVCEIKKGNYGDNNEIYDEEDNIWEGNDDGDEDVSEDEYSY